MWLCGVHSFSFSDCLCICICLLLYCCFQDGLHLQRSVYAIKRGAHIHASVGCWPNAHSHFHSIFGFPFGIESASKCISNAYKQKHRRVRCHTPPAQIWIAFTFSYEYKFICIAKRKKFECTPHGRAKQTEWNWTYKTINQHIRMIQYIWPIVVPYTQSICRYKWNKNATTLWKFHYFTVII